MKRATAVRVVRAQIGIDPGLTGALALLVDGQARAVADMPLVADGRARSIAPALLADNVRALIDGLPPATQLTVYIERVAAMPKQGVASTFTFGKTAGLIEGVIGALGLPYRLVTPSVWKRKAQLIGKPKDASRALALSLYPELSNRLARKKDNGRADALLIARFGPLLCE